MENAIRELTVAIENLEKHQYDIIDYIAIILSLIAIVVSIYGIYSQKKMNDVNLQAAYFKEIFGDYLKNKIPEVCAKLNYDENGKLNKSYREISFIFFDMIQECGYFKYADNDFFFDLKNMVKELDEELVEMAGDVEKDKSLQKKNIIKIHARVEKIFARINKAYQNC